MNLLILKACNAAKSEALNAGHAMSASALVAFSTLLNLQTCNVSLTGLCYHISTLKLNHNIKIVPILNLIHY